MPNKIKAKTNPNSLLKSKIIAAESKSFPRHFIFCNAIFVGNCRFKKVHQPVYSPSDLRTLKSDLFGVEIFQPLPQAAPRIGIG